MRHIAVLVHESDAFDQRYLLHAVARVWREKHGIETTVLRGLRKAPPRANLAILHVDRSIVPEKYLALARRFPVALNVRAADTSKRAVSGNLVHRGDGYNGPA